MKKLLSALGLIWTVILQLTVASTRIEVLDAPDVHVELVDRSFGGFHLLKTEDLRLRCTIRVPSSIRLSETMRKIVWRYNEADLIGSVLPTDAFYVDDDILVLKASPDIELLVGRYACNVSWPTYASVLSPPISVRLAVLKKFKGDSPTEVRVPVGQTAYLPCQPPESHPGPPKIWFSFNNGTRDILFSRDRYYLTKNSLQIARVEKSDQGSYVCRASNPLSGQSRDGKPIDLVVLDAHPDDESQSASRPSPHLLQSNILNVRSGDNVTLECVTVGGKTTNVGWERYGRMLPKHKKILGNLILYEVTKAEEGVYLCRPDGVASNSSAFRNPNSPYGPYIMYTLNIIEPIKARLSIERDGEEDNKRISTYRLTCRASSGVSTALEFWVNGRPLLSPSLNPIRTEYLRGEWSFTLSQTSLKAGVYQCMASGKGLDDDTVVDSDNRFVTWTKATSGTGTGYVNAFIDQEKDGADGSGMTEQDTRSLLLPSINVAPENETVSPGGSKMFACQVSANTESVFWLKDHQPLVDYESDGVDDDRHPTKRYRRIGTASLEIIDVSSSDRGWYTCVALNSHGNATAKAYLDVDGGADGKGDDGEDPDDENNGEEFGKKGHLKKKGKTAKKKFRFDPPIVYRYSNTSVHLRWQMPEDQSTWPGTVRFFKLQYKKVVHGDRGTNWKTLDQELPSHSHSGTVDGLEPGQRYKFRLAVVFDTNDQALSRTSAPYELIVEKKRISPVTPPTLTNVKAISWSAIGLTWEYGNAENAPIDGFIVFYRRIYYADPMTTFQNDTVIGGMTREHILSHLLPATPYEIKIVAFNTAGRSRESSIIEESTLSTDGTRPPKTFFDASSSRRGPDKMVNVQQPPRSDGSKEPFGIVSQPPSTNQTQKDAVKGNGFLFNLSSDILLYIIGGVLGALFIVLLVFMAVCTLKQHKQKKLNAASKGKFQDVSKKIYVEQASANDRGVMKEMYPPISASTSLQYITTASLPRNGTSSGVNCSSVPPPPSMTGFGDQCGVVNLYSNPLDDDVAKDHLSYMNSPLNGGFSTDDRLFADDSLTSCDVNKNDLTYVRRGYPTNDGCRHSASNTLVNSRRAHAPLILTSASAITGGGGAGDDRTTSTIGQTFLASPQNSYHSEYSSENADDSNGKNRTPLLPPPLYLHDMSGDNSQESGRESTPVYLRTQNQPRLIDTKTLWSRNLSPKLSNKARNRRLEEQKRDNCPLNGAVSPMSISSHASIGSSSAASGATRPNFSTFKPETSPNGTVQSTMGGGQRQRLLYRNRSSDGYCSDA